MTNEVLECIKNRRSIKKYKSTPVPEEALAAILEAGTYAPTGRNMQAPIIIAVTNKEMRDKLSRLNADVLGTAADPFYGAPVVLVVLAEKGRRTYVHDGALVMGNLMLAAHALGVGSCWIHRAAETFEMPHWKELLASLGLTGDYEGIGNCVLGYADCDLPAPPARKEGRVYYA